MANAFSGGKSQWGWNGVFRKVQKKKIEAEVMGGERYLIQKEKTNPIGGGGNLYVNCRKMGKKTR